MSEVNNTTENTEDLNDAIEEEIDDAEVMTVPIDDTLSISGEAADAKAVGDALAEKADRSELQTNISVDGQTADNQGIIILLAGHIPVDDTENAQTIAQVLASLGARTGADIPIDGSQGAETIAQAINSATGRTADNIPMSGTSEQTVAQAIAAALESIGTNAQDITLLDQKTGSTIKLNTTEATTIAQAIAALNLAAVKSVNMILPDPTTGNVTITTVPFAENLTTEDTKQESGTFIRRTTAGDASISDGYAWLNRMLGNSVHTGFVEEVLQLTVIPITRPTPEGITAELDKTTFEAYVSDAGTYTLTYTSSAWSATLSDYGITVTGTPEDGDSITINWDGENDPEMTVSCPRTPAAEITATINRAAFLEAVSASCTINLYYTTAWSADPATYGVTVTGTPMGGDQITITYVKEERGTITQAQPTALVGTGWNLYERSNGYAKVVKYSETYGYKVGGTYTSLSFKETLAGEATAITPDANGLFNVAKDGYVIVEGGSTDTYILTAWSDWQDGPVGGYRGYTESRVDLSAIMQACFPYGLMKVGTAQDEIDRNALTATSWVQRIAYSAEARADAEASGLQYDFDENYIYIEREDPVITAITLNGAYEISEHGQEFIDGTTVPVYCEILYGENLRDKLRRDCVTKVDGNTADANGNAVSDKLGLYIDTDGYLCQAITTDA